MAANRDFVNSLAVAGETGTLQDEMQGTAAQGRCRGKTGTLARCRQPRRLLPRARDGHNARVRVPDERDLDPDYVHAIEGDRMAAALARYDG